MTGPADYPRDMVGYGPNPPHPQWPGGANIAVQFVLNYEEGAENSVLHGDQASETFLSEIVGAQPFPNRHMSMESLYEYGSRAGLWRVLRVFGRRELPLTIFGVAMALARNPQALAAFVQRGDEIACHGLRWVSYQLVEPEVERGHIAEAVRLMTELTGEAPLGWYTGRDSPQTRRLVVEHGGFLYDADSYADDCRTGRPSTTPTTWWCPTHWTPTTCGSRALADSEAATSSSHICATHSTCSTRKARRVRRRCCRSGCTAGWSAGRPASPHSNASSITCRLTTRCGSPVASTSRDTGLRTFHPVRRISLASWLIRWTTRSEKISGRPPRRRRSPRRRHQSLDCWHSHRPFPGRHAGRSPGPAGHARAIEAAQRPIGALRQSDACA